MGAELIYTQRGGDVTFHGPGQAILYPIISLRDVGIGARKYVEKLELTMVSLASLYGVKAHSGRADKEVTSLRRETNIDLLAEEAIHEQLISCSTKLFEFDSIFWKDDAASSLDNQQN